MKRYIKADIIGTLDEDVDSKYDWAQHSTNSRELARLANDPESQIRRFVAKNPNTPVETLWQLAEDSHIGVRLAVYSNPSTPDSLKFFIQTNRGRKAPIYEYRYYIYYPEEMPAGKAAADIKRIAKTVGAPYNLNWRYEDFYYTYAGRLVYIFECGPFDEYNKAYALNDQLKAAFNENDYDVDYVEVEQLIK